MPTKIIMPALGMAQETGKLLEWVKAEGERVTEGEVIAVIETDKATADLEAPATGILSNVTAGVGDEVPVGETIAVILAPNEAESARTQIEPSSPAVAPTSSEMSSTRGAAERAVSISNTLGRAPAMGASGRQRSSPLARRLASERQINLTQLHGSGPSGAIIAADVLRAQSVQPAARSQPVAQAGHLATRVESEMSAAWRLMAERTTHSWTTIPHFFLTREVNATHLIAARQRITARATDTTENISYTDLLIKLVAEALRQHPRVNATWQNGAIIPNDEINIGLAVAVEDGLVAPVIHQADDLTLAAIARRRSDLVARALAKKLRLSDLADGVFTISNLGMYGVDAFMAIINEPQAAILAVGRIADRVVPENGHAVVRPMMTLTLSCDHRVIDGARGAQFLATVAELIEEPAPLFY